MKLREVYDNSYNGMEKMLNNLSRGFWDIEAESFFIFIMLSILAVFFVCLYKHFINWLLD